MRIVVFVEGGLVQDVIDLDAVKPENGIDYQVVDYDQFDGDPREDIKERWANFTPELRAYMERVLPAETALFKNGGK